MNATVENQYSNRLGVSVTLRRATPADAALILAWRAEPSAGIHQPLRPTTLPRLQRNLAVEASLPLDAHFTGTARLVIETSSGPAGWITLRDVNRDHRLGEVGYTIAEAFRGRGVASAAVRALLPLAFNDVDLDRLGAVAAVANVASRRVLERCDFRFEGITRSYLIIDGQRVDHARYGLLRDEWLRSERIDHKRQERP